MKKRKVLWLCSWYPDKTEPYNGDFVKRHAAAVSAFCNIHVIHVVRDEKGLVTNDIKTEEYGEPGFTETIIYYNVNGLGIRLYERYLSHNKHEQLFRQAVNKYIAENGVPDLVHVHTGMKAGLTALWMKKQFGTSYVVTEHWSGFLDNAVEKFTGTSALCQRQWKKVISGANGVSAVSAVLAAGLAKHFRGIRPAVIPNVVDTTIFNTSNSKAGNGPVFLHVSGMQELKNPLQILQAFERVIKAIPSARLQMIGARPASLLAYTKEKGLEKMVQFFDEMPQEELATHMQAATALVLYSSYETFGCVIIEANACGVPVIVSDIPAFHETVREGENGTFVPPADINALAKAMIAMSASTATDKNKIAAPVTGRYSYEVVGKMFAGWYETVLQP